MPEAAEAHPRQLPELTGSDSHVWLAGEAVRLARRVASADGSLLAVVQESRGAGTARARNFQLYRRRPLPGSTS